MKNNSTKKPQCSIYIVQGNASHLESLIEEERSPSVDYETCWTCPATVKENDLMLIYLMSPISAIVGYARFTSDPFINDEPGSDWDGKRMAVYRDLNMLPADNYIYLKELRVIFPDWFWLKRPQGATAIPDKEGLRIKEPFVSLLAERDKRFSSRLIS